MPHALGRVFLTPTTVAGPIKALAPASSAATSATKAAWGALTSGTRQLVPETTTNASATVPPATTAWNDVGWGQVPIPLGDTGTLIAGSAAVSVPLLTSNAFTANVTIILYWGDVEIGRLTTSKALTTTASAVTGTITWSTTNTLPANGYIGLAIYLEYPVNLSLLNTTTVTMNYGATAFVDAGITWTQQSARAPADTLAVTDVVTRRASSARAVADPVPTSELANRSYMPARTVIDLTTLSERLARAITFVRTPTDATTVAEVVTRQGGSFARTISGTITTSETIRRDLIYGRTIADNIGTTGTGAPTGPTYSPPTLYQLWPRGDLDAT